MIRARLPRGDDPDVLAHPLAEPGVVRHLPVAARDARGHARQHHPRLSHPLSLQQLPRDGRPLSRGAHRARALDDLLPGDRDLGRELSDLDRVAVGADRGALAARSTSAGPRLRASWACPRPAPRPSASTASTTPRASSSGCTRSSGCSRSTRSGSASSAFVQVAAPTRSSLEEYRSFQERIERLCERINKRFGSGRATGRSILLRAAPRATRRSTSCTAPPTSASSPACTTA